SVGCFISGEDAMPTSKTCRLPNLNPCSTSYGPMRLVRNSRGTTNGAWVTWSCGTTGARCTGVILSTRLRVESCIAPRLKVKLGRAPDALLETHQGRVWALLG